MSKDKLLHFQYRYSNNLLECCKTVDLKRKTKGHPVDMARIALPLFYDEPRAINSKKVSDLELLDFVPPMHAPCFLSPAKSRHNSLVLNLNLVPSYSWSIQCTAACAGS